MLHFRFFSSTFMRRLLRDERRINIKDTHLAEYIASTNLWALIINRSFVFVLFFGSFLSQFCTGAFNTPHRVFTGGVIDKEKH